MCRGHKDAHPPRSSLGLSFCYSSINFYHCRSLKMPNHDNVEFRACLWKTDEFLFIVKTKIEPYRKATQIANSTETCKLNIQTGKGKAERWCMREWGESWQEHRKLVEGKCWRKEGQRDRGVVGIHNGFSFVEEWLMIMQTNGSKMKVWGGLQLVCLLARSISCTNALTHTRTHTSYNIPLKTVIIDDKCHYVVTLIIHMGLDIRRRITKR